MRSLLQVIHDDTWYKQCLTRIQCSFIHCNLKKDHASDIQNPSHLLRNSKWLNIATIQDQKLAHGCTMENSWSTSKENTYLLVAIMTYITIHVTQINLPYDFLKQQFGKLRCHSWENYWYIIATHGTFSIFPILFLFITSFYDMD